MKPLVCIFLVGILLVSSCNNEPKASYSTTATKADSTIASNDSMSRDVKQNIIENIEVPTIASRGPFKDQVFTSDDTRSEYSDFVAGEGPRYVFGCIMYTSDDDAEANMWLSDIMELHDFSEDTQARFLDQCIKDCMRDNLNRRIRVVTRTAFVAYRYSIASDKRIDVQNY